MHSSLAVTTDGLPLGLAAVKFWTRKKFKGTNALRGKVNPTRVPIEQKESVLWLENLRQSTAPPTWLVQARWLRKRSGSIARRQKRFSVATCGVVSMRM
jgi:hypothetical protein